MKKRLGIFFVLGILVYDAHTQSVNQGSLNSHQQYWQTHRSELKLEKNYVAIATADVPSKLQKTLDNNKLYNGWQDSPLYIDRDTKIYTLYIKRDSTIIMYGFNDRGKAVTYDSYNINEK